MAKSGTIFMASGCEGLLCYVCGSNVVGRYYNLASCRTQATKVKLIEKLGQLVGDDFLVIVSEEDTICKNCATMINSLDRLEKELTSLRTMVLKYIEKKYQINDGELVNSRASVTPCNNGGGGKLQSSNGSNGFVDFLTRKKRAMCGEINPDELKDSKEITWLQCDRCKFTTHCNQNAHVQPQQPPALQRTMPSLSTKHHTEKSVTQTMSVAQTDIAHAPMIIQRVEKQHNEDDNRPPSLGSVDEFGVTGDANRTLNVVGGKEEEEVIIKKYISDELDNVEMITGDISGASNFQDEHLATIEQGQMLQMTSDSSSSKHVTLQSIEGEDGQNTLCMVDENGLIVQKVEQAEDGTLYVQMPDGSDPTKQMLSVGEDGSVQMVEVLWGDDIGQSDDTEAAGSHHNIVSF